MTTIGELVVKLSGSNAALKTALLESGTASEAFATRAEASSARSSAALRGVGLAAVGITAGVIAFGAEATHSAASFQASMELIRTQAGATQVEVEAMSKGILELAPKVGTGPEALAAALYHIESAGLRGAKALDVLTIAAEGAKVGHANLESVTNALVAANQSGVKGITSMAQAMGTLNGIVGAGNMRMQDLADAFGTGVLSSAKNFGVSIQSLGAALASMTDQGIPAVDAATRLNSAMRLMAAPTSKAVKELASIGITSTQLAGDLRSPGGMLTAIQDLKTHLEASGLSATQQAALLANAFGGKQSGGILTLVGNIDLLKAKVDAVGKGAGGFGAAWAATAETADQAGADIEASFSSITDSVGTGLLPAISKVLGVFVPVVQGVAAWAAANQPLAATILLVVGGVAALAAGLVFLGPIVGALAAVLGIILSPIGLIVLGIGFLLVKLNLLAPIAGAIGDAVSFLATVFSDLMDPLGGVGLAMDDINETFGIVHGKAQTLGDMFAALAGKLLNGLGKVASSVAASVAAALPGIVAQLAQWAQAFIAWVEPMIPPALQALGALLGQILSWIVAQLPGIAAQLGAWAQAFIGWVGPMIPPLLGALGDLASQMIAWVASQLPVWVAQLLKWAQAFIDWVAPLIPPLLGELGKLAVQLIAWILRQIPVVAVAIGKVAIEFVSWVVAHIPALLLALGQFGVALIGWVVAEIPVVAGALLDMAAAFIGWVVDSIPGLLANLAAWLVSLLQWIGTIPGQVYDAFKAVGKAIFDGILDGIGNIAKAVGDKLNSIPGVSIVGGVVSFGGSVVSNTIGGVGQLGSNIGNTIGNLTGGGGSGGPTSNGTGSKNLQQFALGGIVPGSGPQLAIVHGGERIIPANAAAAAGGTGTAAGGSAVPVEIHTHLHLGDREIGEVVDRFLYDALGIHQQQAPATGSAR